MHASEFVKDAMKKAGMTDEEIHKLNRAPELRCSLAHQGPAEQSTP